MQFCFTKVNRFAAMCDVTCFLNFISPLAALILTCLDIKYTMFGTFKQLIHQDKIRRQDVVNLLFSIECSSFVGRDAKFCVSTSPLP
jgi:hypothetical protein